MAIETSIWMTAHDVSKDDTVIQISETSQGIFVVTLNSPETHHVLTPQIMGALARAIDRLSAMDSDKITAIILTSSGKSFCAGLDINACSEDPKFEEYMSRDVDAFYAIQESPVPIVACVHGAAMTGGFEIALSCDIVIASRDAIFRDNHAMYGFFPIRGLSQLLPRLCGQSNARLACMASYPIPATKALSWNLVSEVVESPEDLLPAALRIAQGLTYNRGPVLRALKKSMNEGSKLPYGAARQLELSSSQDYFHSLGDDRTPVVRAGAKRFNKRVAELDTPEGMRGGMAGPD